MFELAQSKISFGINRLAYNYYDAQYKRAHKKNASANTKTQVEKHTPVTKPEPKIKAEKVELKVENKSTNTSKQKNSEDAAIKINIDVSAEEAKKIEPEKVQEKINDYIKNVGEENFAESVQTGKTADFEKFVRSEVVDVQDTTKPVNNNVDKEKLKAMKAVVEQTIAELDGNDVSVEETLQAMARHAMELSVKTPAIEQDDKFIHNKKECERISELKRSVDLFRSLPSSEKSKRAFDMTLRHFEQVNASILMSQKNNTEKNDVLDRYIMSEVFCIDPDKYTTEEVEQYFFDGDEVDISSGINSALKYMGEKLEAEKASNDSTVLDLTSNVVKSDAKPLIIFEDDEKVKEIKEESKKRPTATSGRKKKKTAGEDAKK